MAERALGSAAASLTFRQGLFCLQRAGSFHFIFLKLMAPPDTALLCIALCTYKRHTLLAKALDSMSRLLIPKQCRVEAIVIDNDLEGSSRSLVERKAKSLAFACSYEIEEQRGIAYARNKALDCALRKKAESLAFFDDDGELAPDWLSCLYAHYLQGGAEALTGPQRTRFPENAPQWAMKTGIFQGMSFATGTLRPWAATHNVLFHMSLVRDMGLRFDTAFAFTGGEDQLFFMQAVQKGARIVWVEEAVVTEHVGASMLKFSWVLQRNFCQSLAGVSMYRKLFGLQGIGLSAIKGAAYMALGIFFLLLLVLVSPLFLLAIILFFQQSLGQLYLAWHLRAWSWLSRALGWWLGLCGLRLQYYKFRKQDS